MRPKANFTEQFFTPFWHRSYLERSREHFKTQKSSYSSPSTSLSYIPFRSPLTFSSKSFHLLRHPSHCRCHHSLANKNTSVFRYKSFLQLSPVSLLCLLWFSNIKNKNLTECELTSKFNETCYVIITMSIFLFSSSVCNSSVFSAIPLTHSMWLLLVSQIFVQQT